MVDTLFSSQAVFNSRTIWCRVWFCNDFNCEKEDLRKKKKHSITTSLASFSIYVSTECDEFTLMEMKQYNTNINDDQNRKQINSKYQHTSHRKLHELVHRQTGFSEFWFLILMQFSILNKRKTKKRKQERRSSGLPPILYVQA